MLVERWTWKAKQGHRRELIELIKAWVERNGFTPRVSSVVYGAWDTVSSDLEFETIEDRQKFWEAFDWSQPEVAEFLKTLQNLIESETTCELLRLY
jgi:hypothetical protein